MRKAIEKAIRETLVLVNPQSVGFAVDKIIGLYEPKNKVIASADKKASIYNFAGQDFKSITGYDHNSYIPYDKVFEIAQSIFEKGLNVMIYHLPEGSDKENNKHDVILFVDDKRFSPR